MAERGGGTRKARGLTTAAVVEAAARVADADGAEALTLAKVAAELGVRTPSLYNHVAGLDDLRRRLALLAMAELGAALAAAAVGLAGDDAVRALLHAQRAYARAHPGRYGFLARAPSERDTEAAEAAGAVVAVLTAGLRAYGLAGDEAVHTVRCLRSAVHGFVTLEAGGGFGLPLDLDHSFEVLVELLVAGLAASGTGARA